jgi:hypothetical protein
VEDELMAVAPAVRWRRIARSILTGAALALALATTRPADAAETEVEDVDLMVPLAEFVEQHPQASLAEVAARANALLAKFGLLYRFDDFGEADSVRLAGTERDFVFRYDPVGDGGPCGESFVELPAVRVTREWIDLAQQERIWRVARPETLYLDAMTVLTADQSAVTATVEVPWQTTPSGVTADGRGVVVRHYFWNQGAAKEWWAAQRKSDPAIRAELPFLPLIVTEESIRYADDPALLRDPSANEPEGAESSENAYLRQQEFLQPHFFVEYNEPCT